MPAAIAPVTGKHSKVNFDSLLPECSMNRDYCEMLFSISLVDQMVTYFYKNQSIHYQRSDQEFHSAASQVSVRVHTSLMETPQ